jgi:hypothetical protein
MRLSLRLFSVSGSTKFRSLSLGVFLATTTMLSPTFGEEQRSGKCDVGPVMKTYGKTPWLVYSCTTDKNVVLVSAPGSPAMPFVFCFCTKDGSYQLSGEGTGNKEVTAAAFRDLQHLAEPDIAELIMQTKQVNERKR